jgi:hypothetical protein
MKQIADHPLVIDWTALCLSKAMAAIDHRAVGGLGRRAFFLAR